MKPPLAGLQVLVLQASEDPCTCLIASFIDCAQSLSVNVERFTLFYHVFVEQNTISSAR